MDLGSFFSEVATEMGAQLRKARIALTHPGQKGDVAEQAFRDFLESYLPRSLSVTTGRLIDSNGGGSRQTDVIVSDAALTPVFFRSGSTSVVPVECAYAVVEVKTSLTKYQIPSILDNMLSVRRLKKRAYYRPGSAIVESTLYGKEHEIWPVSYFVFAYECSDLDEFRIALAMEQEGQRQLSVESRVDCVCALDQGVILNWDPSAKKADALPSPGTQMRTVRTEDGLLLFHTLISHYLLQARLPRFRLTDYLGAMNFGAADEVDPGDA